MHIDINLNTNNNNRFQDNQNFIKEIRTFLNNQNKNKTNSKTLSNEPIYYSIDRFINNFAVCENIQTGDFINIPKILIDKNAKVGDILVNKNNKFIIDIEKTKSMQNEIKDLAQSLFKKRNS